MTVRIAIDAATSFAYSTKCETPATKYVLKQHGAFLSVMGKTASFSSFTLTSGHSAVFPLSLRMSARMGWTEKNSSTISLLLWNKVIGVHRVFFCEQLRILPVAGFLLVDFVAEYHSRSLAFCGLRLHLILASCTPNSKSIQCLSSLHSLTLRILLQMSCHE